MTKILMSTALSFSLVATMGMVAPQRAAADARDFIAGAIGGAILNQAIRNNNSNRKVYRKRTYSKKTYRHRLPVTQQGKMIQSSLNYFGFNAGSVDGQLGRKSKQAISQYQAYLGLPVTGELTPFEQNLLTTSYNRAQAGGYAVQQQIAGNPDGTRGLLKTWRAEMAGTSPIPQPPSTVMVQAPAVTPQSVIPQSVTTTVAAVAPVTAAPVAPVVGAPLAATAAAADSVGDALPNLFAGSGAASASLASHCNKISLVTNTNGGFTTVASMSDPDAALSEQFCLARTYAITEGEELGAKLNATPEQLSDYCATYGERLKPHVGALSTETAATVTQDVRGFIEGTNISAPELAATGKVCLSYGYRTDDMDIAAGMALMLTGLGEEAYGELIGHHVSQGFGTVRRPDLAGAWYQKGLDAAEAGRSVFAPGQPERTALIRKASDALNGGAGQVQVTPAAQELPSLPSFAVTE